MHSVLVPLHQWIEETYLSGVKTLQDGETYQSIWQDPSWSHMILAAWYARECFFVWIMEGDVLLTYGIFEKRSVGLGQFGLFCIGWPIGKSESSFHKAFLAASENLCRQETCLFIQIESLRPLEYIGSTWKMGAFKKFIEPYTTLIDLTKTEDEILAAMKPKGRYNIKVAEKNSVTTEWKSCTKENIEAFYALLEETTKRDGFATNSLEYFMTLGEYLEKNNLGNLLFASRENELLAAGLFIYYGKTALYYYGASVSEAKKRKYMASYALQWEAILEGKRRDCATYDFLGIAPPEEIDHHLAGVTDFKLKLSPNIQKWPDARIYAPSSRKYRLFRLLRKIKNLGK